VTAALLPHPPPQLVQVQVQELLKALVQYVQRICAASWIELAK
jgi:hypothetical protein